MEKGLEEKLDNEKSISVESYAGGFILADYSGKRGEASYCGISMSWSTQPVVKDPFSTKSEAIKAGFES